MLSIVLAQKIFSLFVIMAMGFALVRSGVVKPQDSRGISMVALYVISPCMIVTAFQIDLTPEVWQGFLVALLGGFLVQMLYLLLARVLKRPLGLDEVERASTIYSNCGNLVVPLVGMLLGEEMIIYTTAYLVVQTALMWSHGKGLMRGGMSIDVRQMLFGVNMISVYAGMAMFLTGFRLPEPVQLAVGSVGSMVGPAAMLVTGMIMGGIDFRDFLAFKRLPLAVALRLVGFPLAALALLKFGPLAALVPNGSTVLLITLLAACAPSASTINQMAQIYDRNAGYASAINVTSILLCIATMPAMVALYQL